MKRDTGWEVDYLVFLLYETCLQHLELVALFASALDLGSYAVQGLQEAYGMLVAPRLLVVQQTLLSQ